MGETMFTQEEIDAAYAAGVQDGRDDGYGDGFDSGYDEGLAAARTALENLS